MSMSMRSADMVEPAFTLWQLFWEEALRKRVSKYSQVSDCLKF